MHSRDYFYELVNNWTRKQKLKFIKDLSDFDLTELCIDRLDLDFNDCETKDQVIAIANNEYLKNPLKKG